MKTLRVVVPLLVLALGACDSAPSPVSPNTVARAAGVDFTVDQAAEILAPQSQLPNQPMVVDALANLWVDYFLLARTTAEDSTLKTLDVSPLVDLNVDQELVLRLREEVIQVDTSFTDDELRDTFEREMPGARVRARHILLRIPVGATNAEEDSVRALAESLRTRLADGEDFAILAEEFSQDPGSAPNGGDLGSFGRGEMVPQFEAAAFALDEGEISPVVESSLGLHIIRVDERIIPSLDENLDQFRLQLKNRRVMEAESTFVAGIVDDAEIEVHPQAFETARQLSSDPEVVLTKQALNRTLTSFHGGEITLADYRNWVQLRGMAFRDDIQNSTDEQMDGLLRNLARERILVNTAIARGVDVSQGYRDSLATGIREGVKNVVRQMGFSGLTASTPAEVNGVAQEATMDFLRAVVSQGREVIPLGGVAVALRRQHDARIYDAALERAVARVTELRAQMPPAPPPGQQPPAEPATSDSAGTSGGDRNP